MHLSRELSSALINRAHRATLHRLRGVIQILGGWATLGTPEPADEKIRIRMQESQVLSDRLNLLWQFILEAQPDCTDPVIAPALLAGALRFGTPEEAETRLPRIDGHFQAALALSAWLETTTGLCALPKIQLAESKPGWIRVRVNGQPIRLPDSGLMEDFSPYLQVEEMDPTNLGVGAGVFVNGLSLSTQPDDLPTPIQPARTEKGLTAN